jgi:hypothetical protein
MQLFALLLRLLHLNSTPDWNSITTVWVQSGDWQSCAEALTKLVNEQNLLDAYQIGFDLSEVATQGFVESVRRTLAEAGLGPEEGAVSAVFNLGERQVLVLIWVGKERTTKSAGRYPARREERRVLLELPQQEQQDRHVHSQGHQSA